MYPKTFVLVKCNKYEFSFVAAIHCYFTVQKVKQYRSLKIIHAARRGEIICMRCVLTFSAVLYDTNRHSFYRLLALQFNLPLRSETTGTYASITIRFILLLITIFHCDMICPDNAKLNDTLCVLILMIP